MEGLDIPIIELKLFHDFRGYKVSPNRKTKVMRPLLAFI
jgi:hypothetical protein